MRSLVLVLAGCLAARESAAQALHGRVTTAQGFVPGAVVTALDSAGVPLAVALADDSGRFSMRFPSAGRVQLQVSRIGYGPTVDAPISLGAGEVAERTVVATGARVALPETLREPTGGCATTDAASPLHAVWESARVALLSTQLTRLTRGYTMDVALMVRREPADKRQPTSNDHRTVNGAALRALTSTPPEELAAKGYLSQDATGDRFQAPHEEVLLSPSFAATHCLRLLPYDATASTLRVGFEPVAGREVPDVRGVLTLDRATLELRRVDFTYTNLARVGRAGDVTGDIAFRRLPDATWITASWTLTQSIAEQYVQPRPLVAGRFAAPPPPRPEITNGISRVITGGTVLRVRGRDALKWASDEKDVPPASGQP